MSDYSSVCLSYLVSHTTHCPLTAYRNYLSAFILSFSLFFYHLSISIPFSSSSFFLFPSFFLSLHPPPVRQSRLYPSLAPLLHSSTFLSFFISFLPFLLPHTSPPHPPVFPSPLIGSLPSFLVILTPANKNKPTQPSPFPPSAGHPSGAKGTAAPTTCLLRLCGELPQGEYYPYA